MNTKLFLIAVAIVAAFGIAVAVVGPVTLATPALGGGNNDIDIIKIPSVNRDMLQSAINEFEVVINKLT